MIDKIIANKENNNHNNDNKREKKQEKATFWRDNSPFIESTMSENFLFHKGKLFVSSEWGGIEKKGEWGGGEGE